MTIKAREFRIEMAVVNTIFPWCQQKKVIDLIPQ